MNDESQKTLDESLLSEEKEKNNSNLGKRESEASQTQIGSYLRSLRHDHPAAFWVVGGLILIALMV